MSPKRGGRRAEPSKPSAPQVAASPVQQGGRLPRLRAVFTAFAVGCGGALGFPFRLPFVGSGPMFDWAPRELCLVAMGAWIFGQLTGPLPRRTQFGRIAWAMFGFYGVLIAWLDIAMEQFGGMPPTAAWPAVIALFALCAVLSALVVPAFALVRGRGPWSDAAAFAVTWTATEWFRGAWTQFPWGQWGYAMARVLPLCQWAAWGGFYIITFWTALGAAMLYGVVTAPRAARSMAAARLVVWTGVILATGAVRLVGPVTPTEAPWQTVQMGVVQASIGQSVKNNARAHRSTILQTYQALSAEARAKGAEVLIWPEGAWPGYLPGDIARLPTEAVHLPLLLGTGLFEEGGPVGPDGALEPPKVFNAALMTDKDLNIVGRYDKQKLVPFGEFVPLRAVLPVQKLVPGAFDCTPGQGGAPLSPWRMGVLICYDGVYPGPARAHVQAGARVLVNLTNDAWYGLSSAPYQHRDYYVLRAIETGRYVVRAANSGISLVIDPTGRMGPGTAINAVEANVMTVPLAPIGSQTPYVRFGDVWLYVCLAVVAASLLRVALRV